MKVAWGNVLFYYFIVILLLQEIAEDLKKKDSISTSTSKHLSNFERTPSPKKQFSVKTESESSMVKSTSDQSSSSIMWVDKYKPTGMKNIIGQTGDKSNAKKLLNWLNNWHKNRATGVKPSGKKCYLNSENLISLYNTQDTTLVVYWLACSPRV